MGKGSHDEWDGFTKVRNSEGKIVGAVCDKCKQKRTRRDAASLASHKKVCKGLSSQPLQELTGNAQNMQNAVLDAEKEDDSLDNSVNSQSSQGTSPQIMKDSHSKSERIKRETDNNRAIAIMKFFLSSGLDFKHIKSMYCRKMFQTFDADFQLPSVEEFQTIILKSTRDQLCKEVATYHYLSIMSVQVYEIDECIHAVSLAMHSKSEYVFVDYAKIKKRNAM